MRSYIGQIFTKKPEQKEAELQNMGGSDDSSSSSYFCVLCDPNPCGQNSICNMNHQLLIRPLFELVSLYKNIFESLVEKHDDFQDKNNKPEIKNIIYSSIFDRDNINDLWDLQAEIHSRIGIEMLIYLKILANLGYSCQNPNVENIDAVFRYQSKKKSVKLLPNHGEVKIKIPKADLLCILTRLGIEYHFDYTIANFSGTFRCEKCQNYHYKEPNVYQEPIKLNIKVYLQRPNKSQDQNTTSLSYAIKSIMRSIGIILLNIVICPFWELVRFFADRPSKKKENYSSQFQEIVPYPSYYYEYNYSRLGFAWIILCILGYFFFNWMIYLLLGIVYIGYSSEGPHGHDEIQKYFNPVFPFYKLPLIKKLFVFILFIGLVAAAYHYQVTNFSLVELILACLGVLIAVILNSVLGYELVQKNKVLEIALLNFNGSYKKTIPSFISDQKNLLFQDANGQPYIPLTRFYHKMDTATGSKINNQIFSITQIIKSIKSRFVILEFTEPLSIVGALLIGYLVFTETVSLTQDQKNISYLVCGSMILFSIYTFVLQMATGVFVNNELDRIINEFKDVKELLSLIKITPNCVLKDHEKYEAKNKGEDTPIVNFNYNDIVYTEKYLMGIKKSMRNTIPKVVAAIRTLVTSEKEKIKIETYKDLNVTINKVAVDAIQRLELIEEDYAILESVVSFKFMEIFLINKNFIITSSITLLSSAGLYIWANYLDLSSNSSS